MQILFEKPWTTFPSPPRLSKTRRTLGCQVGNEAHSGHGRSSRTLTYKNISFKETSQSSTSIRSALVNPDENELIGHRDVSFGAKRAKPLTPKIPQNTVPTVRLGGGNIML